MTRKTSRTDSLARVASYSIVLVLSMLVSTARPARGQGEAQLQILNAGINLGWIDGIAASEGVTAANIAEVGTDLANASAAISALIPLISAPYETRGFVRANEAILALSGEIGGLPRNEIRARIARIVSLLKQSLDVYLSARSGRLEYASTCDLAILNVGFAFGQGHTAIQRGNTEFERRARGNFNAAVSAGERASRRLGCSFSAGPYRGLPMLKVPSGANYSAALAPVQAATLTGAAPTVAPLPATPTPPPALPPGPTPPVPALPPGGARAGPSTGIYGRTWTTSYGEMTFDGSRGRYSEDQGSLVDLSLNGRTLTGYWVEKSSARRCAQTIDGSPYWGRIEYTFDESFTSFTGIWSYCDGSLSRSWSGRASGSR